MLEGIFYGTAAASLLVMVLYAAWSYSKVRHAQEEDEAQDFQESLDASEEAAHRYRKTYRQEEVGSQALEEIEDDEADWWKNA